MANWDYKNVQFRTVPTLGVWRRISERDLGRLARLQGDGWEVYHTVELKGAFGFTAHVLFLLRRERATR
jgi:hypothetical protein